MNRIEQLFKEKKQNVLSIYFTAGYPLLNDTVEIIKSLDSANVDLIEIGMPFSDPLADGPTIQEANTIALKNGMSISVLLAQLKNIRQNTQIPILLMGYLNPIIQYGLTKFITDIKAIGVDGIIIPDMPLDYYITHLKNICDKNEIVNVLLITPSTSIKRIVEMDKNTTGFLYLVSSNGITGNQLDTSSQLNYFNTIKSLNLKNPTMLGFGIHDKITVQHAFNNCNGAIIGSAFIKLLQEQGTDKATINAFIKNLLP